MKSTVSNTMSRYKVWAWTVRSLWSVAILWKISHDLCFLFFLCCAQSCVLCCYRSNYLWK